VVEPIYDAYLVREGRRIPGPAHSDVFLVATTGSTGRRSRAVSLEYTAGGPPVIRPPVASISVTGATIGKTLDLNLGDTLTLTATPVIRLTIR